MVFIFFAAADLADLRGFENLEGLRFTIPYNPYRPANRCQSE